MRRSITAALAAAGLLLGAGACGDDSSGSGSGSTGAASTDEPIVISAAASLTKALGACGPADARRSFAGSDELAAQIRQGVKPDVFAAANTKLPDQLAQEGRLETPRVFATNELVVAVPANSKVTRVEDLARKGVTLAIGSKTVPVGAYTRKVLARLPATARSGIEANVRSEEPDVKGVVGKVVQGAADAGFVYVTDVRAASGRLKAVKLPAALQPVVRYGAGVVKGAPHAGAARAYLESLVSGDCQRALRAAGFGAPPG